MNYTLRPSTKKDKKFMLIDSEGKATHFGAKEYEDYTIHKDEKRM